MAELVLKVCNKSICSLTCCGIPQTPLVAHSRRLPGPGMCRNPHLGKSEELHHPTVKVIKKHIIN